MDSLYSLSFPIGLTFWAVGEPVLHIAGRHTDRKSSRKLLENADPLVLQNKEAVKKHKADS
jgi:hypothetical protein